MENWEHYSHIMKIKNERKIMYNFKISIITSCYNAEKFLDETYTSIINQTHDNWEWVLIDDFSEDNTKQKINEICSRDNRIKTLEAKTKKQYWWNPQKAATGDLFFHHDSDDSLLPKTLQHANYFFNKFPDVFFLHFFENKFTDTLPKNEKEYTNNFLENVYLSTDNDSFLEGFEKLTTFRTDIFGKPTGIMKNIKGLEFPVYDDGDGLECSSNDGQWCLVGEEHGKWMTIPRTACLVRRSGGTEQFTKWNIRGEAKLVIDAQKRRKNLILEQPRNIKYFDEIYELAESVYLNTLNYQSERKTLSFLNFDFDEIKQKKTKVLFYDHNIVFDDYKNCDYYFLNFRTENEPSEIISYLSKIKNKSKITVFCYNTHLMHNNKTGRDFMQELCDELNKKGYQYFFNIQKNRFFALFDNINVEDNSNYKPVIESEIVKNEPIEKNVDIVIEKDSFNILHINPENTDDLKDKIINDTMISESRAGYETTSKDYIDITQNDLQKFDVIVNHDIQLNNKLKELYIPFMTVVHENDELDETLLEKSLINVSYKQDIKKKLDLRHFSIGVYKEKYFSKETRNTKFVFPNVPKLICVERNIEKSYAHLSLIAAREMHLPITLITPNPNTECEQYKTIQLALKDFDTEHDQVEYLTEVTDDQLNDLYNDNHFFISLNENYMSYDLLNALSTGMVCLGLTVDKTVPGIETIKPSKKSIVESLRNLIKENKYEQMSSLGLNFSKRNSWDFALERNKINYQDFISLKNNVPLSMKERLIDVYENTENKTENTVKEVKPTLEINFKEGNPIATLLSEEGKEFNVVFKNKKTGEIPFSTMLKHNHWAAGTEKYFIPWLIYVEDTNGEILFEYDFIEEIKKRKTHVYFDSNSIGDNMAWMPAVEEFRKKYNIKNLTCSTFFNGLFEKNYPEIKFVDPNTGFNDFEIQYRIPWLEKGQFNPLDCRETSLQNVCASILGCDGMTEVSAKITVKEKETLFKRPYVAIGMQSTAQAKYWNNPGGWEKLTDYIQKKGYDVVFVDKHEHFGKEPHMNSNPSNAMKRNERTLDQTIATIAGSEFFIGIGSGLSWISWALNKEVILISGFSQPFSEFQNKCTRIINTDVCHGCYNRVKLDPSNWTWCPDHEGTDRMFECTKNISVETVCNAVDNVIQKLTNE